MSLANWRTKCEHGRWDAHGIRPAAKELPWRCCPGGVALATRCGNCGGTGIDPAWHEGLRLEPACTVPDCVEGWVLADGWEWMQWCGTHKEAGTEVHHDIFTRYFGRDECVFGWRPIGPAKEAE